MDRMGLGTSQATTQGKDRSTIMQTIETNEYGNVDIQSGVPKGLTHIPQATYGKLKIGVLCKRLRCPSASAVTGFRKSWRYWKPVIDGVVVPNRRRRKVLAEISLRLAARQSTIKRTKRDPFAGLAQEYGTARNALLDAATAMLDLNRHAKSCPKLESQDIYALKNRFIRLLYEDGKCTSVQRHLHFLPAKECWSCEGFGCDRCNDTGEYLSARKVTNYVFTFEIDGTKFCWHQPKQTINYPVTVTLPDASMPVLTPKPLERWASKLTYAKRLVSWVVNNLDPDSTRVEDEQNAIPVLAETVCDKQATFEKAS